MRESPNGQRIRLIVDISQSQTGVGRYSSDLLLNLSQFGGGQGNRSYQISNLSNYSLPVKNMHCTWTFLYKPFRFLATPVPYLTLIRAPRNLVEPKFDVFHSTIGEPARTFPLNLVDSYKIWNVHDLLFEIMPEVCINFGSPLLSWIKRARGYTFRGADKLLVLSNATKTDLLSYFKFHESKVVVLPVGRSPFYNSDPKPNVIKEKFGISEYMVCISTIEPRKNYETLLRAVALLPPGKEKLVVVGRMGWRAQHIPKMVKALGIEDRVLFAGFLPDSWLPAVVSNAKLYIYPTLYEGSGTLLLDPMSSGVPIISSKIPCMIEAAEDAALLVEPKDEHALADAIGSVLSNRALRLELIESGRARAKMFRWEDSVKKLLAVYDSAKR